VRGSRSGFWVLGSRGRAVQQPENQNQNRTRTRTSNPEPGTMPFRLMRRLFAALCGFLLLSSASASAQEPPPRIGPFVLDVHATVPRFPSDNAQLAASRGLSPAQLPGTGLGIQIGAHVYVLRLKAITFGLGAEVATGRATKTPDPSSGLAP